MVQSAPAKISLEHESRFQWHAPLVCKLPLSQFLSPRVLVLVEIAERKPPRRKKPSVWSCRKAKEKNTNADQSRIEYKRVAWCFFRPIGTTGHLKIPTLSLDNPTPSNMQRRLQLFEYQPVRWLDMHHARKHWDVENHSKNQPAEKIPAIFVQFQKRVRSPVRCSLHVKIRPVATSIAPPSPRHLEGKTEQPSNLGNIEEESGDNQAPPETEAVQPDESKESYQTEAEPVDPADDELSPLMLYRRNGLEPCLIPQRVLYRLHTGRKGCSAVAFSPDGLFISAAVHHITTTSDEWVVNIYEIHSGCLWQVCRGAQSMLHSLEWSSSTAILSASEGVVLLWGLSGARNATSVQPQTTWHHTPSPVFVYCAIFMPTDPGIVISGASDGCVRLWRLRNDDLGHHQSESTPVVQWKASDGAIHSVRVEAKSQRLFCGDSLGNISVWTPSGPQDKYKPPSTAYERIKVIQTGQLSIASMQLHPRKPHLLVLTHPHTLLHFELRSYLLLHKSYSGITCDHLLVKPSFSPDGRFVVSGSEDGVPQLFTSLHGERMAKGVWGQRFFHGAPILEIAWSPRAHIVAMSAYGGNHPIVVLCARPEDEETDVQHPDPEHGYISGSPLDTKSRTGRSSGGLNGVSSMTHQEEERVQRALERRRQRLEARLNREMTADRDA
ncbi:hypothetical protein Poli38472_004078 [Pythium oligandrum]|uniref:Uncharacterized protein n=1 Tax=Pythium oligandrum TaxID=41045 RepID=A0A8K1FQ69_PYTOL|nr:hypothetical protein Poli38472_004078 [Pythium oligandrum]|eukprot:TMW66313.1 hypothetical protein Poli38472_004078 [Pythium oligandrum]